jgi:hypothetical protein
MADYKLSEEAKAALSFQSYEMLLSEKQHNRKSFVILPLSVLTLQNLDFENKKCCFWKSSITAETCCPASPEAGQLFKPVSFFTTARTFSF